MYINSFQVPIFAHVQGSTDLIIEQKISTWVTMKWDAHHAVFDFNVDNECLYNNHMNRLVMKSPMKACKKAAKCCMVGSTIVCSPTFMFMSIFMGYISLN